MKFILVLALGLILLFSSCKEQLALQISPIQPPPQVSTYHVYEIATSNETVNGNTPVNKPTESSNQATVVSVSGSPVRHSSSSSSSSSRTHLITTPSNNPTSSVPSSIPSANTNLPSNSSTNNQEKSGQVIQSAIDQAASGSTILVESGTYSFPLGESLRVDKDNLIVRGLGQVILKSNGSRAGVTLSGNNLIFENFMLDGFAVGVLFGNENTQHNLTVRNITETNCGDGFDGIYEPNRRVPSVILDGGLFENIVEQNSQATAIGWQCGGAPCQNIHIKNAHIDLTGSSGNSGADGIAMEYGKNVLVEDSTVIGAAADGYDFKSDNVTILNSVVAHVGGNGVKFWHDGQLINSIVTDTGSYAALVGVSGKYLIADSIIAFHNRDYAYVATFGSLTDPVNVTMRNCIFYNNSGSITFPPAAKLNLKNLTFTGGTQTGRYIDSNGTYYGDQGSPLQELDPSLVEVAALPVPERLARYLK